MAPVDRIKRAANQEQAAALDRALLEVADEVEQLLAAREGADLLIQIRVHRGHVSGVETRRRRRHL